MDAEHRLINLYHSGLPAQGPRAPPVIIVLGPTLALAGAGAWRTRYAGMSCNLAPQGASWRCELDPANWSWSHEKLEPENTGVSCYRDRQKLSGQNQIHNATAIQNSHRSSWPTAFTRSHNEVDFSEW